MFIKVKIVDENMMPKGRAYTYKSGIDVTEGEFVVADMAGHDKTLVVVETDLNPAEFEGVDYEIKSIKGLASEIEPEAAPTLDIVIEQESLPVIKMNFEAVKFGLAEMLTKYKGVVVTKETLSGCKSTQKELAGYRNKLDTYRKDKKKLLSKPITDFENQCKELISLIEQVELPIKEGIKTFDDQKRSEKHTTAERLIKEVISETELNEKYGARLDVSEKYCLLGAKECDVKDDLTARAMALKVEQDREAELVDIIKDTIDTENKRIIAKLDFSNFSRMIERGMPTKDILAEVKASADRIYRAEHPEPTPEVIPEPIPEPVQETIIAPVVEEIQKEEEPLYYAVYRVSGTVLQLRALSAYIVDSGMTKSVLEQGAV